MSLHDLTNGLSSPCLYKDDKKDCALLVRGDDIIFSGFPKEFEALIKHLLELVLELISKRLCRVFRKCFIPSYPR